VNSAYHHRVAFRRELGNSTSSQLRGTSPTILIPVGSTEQHGPHLPLDTDTRIATAVARTATEGLNGSDQDQYLLAPAIAYGASGEHEGFPGTVSIGT
jgi:creatinine amidohydrolase/Fe(II)-dependent formamide hydrolase-like protein